MTPHTDLAHRLIRNAARRAPAALTERLQEEWLADLHSRKGTMSRLRLALGCYWAIGTITRDFSVPQLATSGTGGSVRTGFHELSSGLPVLSRRTITFLVIAGLHVLVIYGFSVGLRQHFIKSDQTVTQASVNEMVDARRPPPPAIKDPTLSRVEVVTPIVDPPFIPTNDPVTQTRPETPVATDLPPTGQVAQTPPPLHRVQGGPGKGFPNPDDFYPSTSRRLSETGSAVVQVCVDPQGRLDRSPTLAQTSGIRRLDDAAVQLAAAGSGHYRPSTEDGRAVASCYPYKVRFTLHD